MTNKKANPKALHQTKKAIKIWKERRMKNILQMTKIMIIILIKLMAIFNCRRMDWMGMRRGQVWMIGSRWGGIREQGRRVSPKVPMPTNCLAEDRISAGLMLRMPSPPPAKVVTLRIICVMIRLATFTHNSAFMITFISIIVSLDRHWRMRRRNRWTRSCRALCRRSFRSRISSSNNSPTTSTASKPNPPPKTT